MVEDWLIIIINLYLSLGENASKRRNTDFCCLYSWTHGHVLLSYHSIKRGKTALISICTIRKTVKSFILYAGCRLMPCPYIDCFILTYWLGIFSTMYSICWWAVAQWGHKYWNACCLWISRLAILKQREGKENKREWGNGPGSRFSSLTFSFAISQSPKCN